VDSKKIGGRSLSINTAEIKSDDEEYRIGKNLSKSFFAQSRDKDELTIFNSVGKDPVTP